MLRDIGRCQQTNGKLRDCITVSYMCKGWYSSIKSENCINIIDLFSYKPVEG